MHPGIVLDLPDEGPVRLALVHLAAGAAVDGQGLDADVLQALGQLHDDLGAVVPAQAGLDGDGLADGLDDGLGDGDHLVRLAHHAAAGAPAGDLADRAAEVDVDEVAAVTAHEFGGMVGHLRGPHHRVGVAAVDLDADGGLFVRVCILAYGLLGVSDQAFGRDELRIDHVGALLAAYSPEGSVGHVLHRRQQHRLVSQVYVPYLHFNQ